MSGTGWLKRRLRADAANDSVADEGAGLTPAIDNTEDVDQAMVEDLVDQDPDQVPNRVDAPPPPTTEEAGVEGNK